MNAAAAPILTKHQAEAIYSAMVALNNVAAPGCIRISLPGVVGKQLTMIEVAELATDRLKISYGGGMLNHEREYHGGQAAFAAAYGVA